jgi:hypothetical protein
MTGYEGPRRPAFRTGIDKRVKPSHPESLFQDLRTKAPDIQYLWAHQADLLRTYNREHLETPDVALELPTGTGKTLIGLLIAEYRRRKLDERVVYLCPTRQLAHQVGEHARRYGIDARVLLPPRYENISDFQLGDAVGVMTYSGIFNTNPRVNDPQSIILDDAHSSEDYIAGLWSVAVSRGARPRLYEQLLRLFERELEEAYVESMLDYNPTPSTLGRVDMLPHPRFWKHAGEIRALLDEVFVGDADERFSWRMIRDALHACCLFVSWNELLLRPIIPPTLTHAPFAHAKQRVYMSATLGKGGELERITGVRRIRRLPVPEGWERQSSGRRLFLFPNRSMEDEDIEAFASNAIKEGGRALVLTPSMAGVSAAQRSFAPRGIQVLTARDVEGSLGSFTSRTDATLVLANRYDGIDLPGQSCRLLIMEGLPVGTNLQERFLLTRLGESSLLRDRLRTRFTQGVGRCCRSSSDFAVVLAIGQRLFDFCAKRENRSGMHPELQAELEFGIANSEDPSSDYMLSLMRIFYERGEDAAAAEQEILRLRSEMSVAEDPAARTLMEVANTEVDFVYALWRKDYASALENALRVSDALGGDDTAGYRAWWYYLGGSAAWLGGQEGADDSSLVKARELFGRAARLSKSISWFAELSRETSPDERPLPEDVYTVRACESVHEALVRLGFSGKSFGQRMTELVSLLARRDSGAFERGLQMLGDLLGFDARRPEGKGAPDGVWLLTDHLAVALEAKSDEDPEGAVSLNTVRQAVTHPAWVENHCRISTDAELVNVLVTPRQSVDAEAALIAGDLRYANIDIVRAIADELVVALRRMRSVVSESDRVGAIDVIREELHRAGLLPQEVLERFRTQTVADLPVNGSDQG